MTKISHVVSIFKCMFDLVRLLSYEPTRSYTLDISVCFPAACFSQAPQHMTRYTNGLIAPPATYSEHNMKVQHKRIDKASNPIHTAAWAISTVEVRAERTRVFVQSPCALQTLAFTDRCGFENGRNASAVD